MGSLYWVGQKVHSGFSVSCHNVVLRASTQGWYIVAAFFLNLAVWVLSCSTQALPLWRGLQSVQASGAALLWVQLHEEALFPN